MNEISEDKDVFITVQFRRYVEFIADLFYHQDGRNDSPIVASFGISRHSTELQM